MVFYMLHELGSWVWVSGYESQTPLRGLRTSVGHVSDTCQTRTSIGHAVDTCPTRSREFPIFLNFFTSGHVLDTFGHFGTRSEVIS